MEERSSEAELRCELAAEILGATPAVIAEVADGPAASIFAEMLALRRRHAELVTAFATFVPVRFGTDEELDDLRVR